MPFTEHDLAAPRERSLVARRPLVLVAAAALATTALVGSLEPRSESAPCELAPDDLGAFVEIPGGAFVQGTREVVISPFRLQVHEVTNRQFAEFVEATGYVTEAERKGGSARFRESETSWWSIDSNATWKTPNGAGSTLEGRSLHPVVHVTLNDARAYAEWAGGRIPTEMEWEYAASLGLFDPQNPDSGVRRPDGTLRANIWTGVFPVMNSRLDGHEGIAPVGCFEPGRTGAYDMIGNVWEWTTTQHAPAVPRFTIKGGSYLCSEDHCRRYRVTARESLEVDFSTAHVGFRLVRDMP